MLNFDMFRDYDNFVEFFKKNDEDKELRGLTLLDRYVRYVESLNDKAVRKLTYTLYGKWPHTTNMSIIRAGAKRAIQHRYYTQLLDRDTIPANVLRRDHRIIEQLDLRDEPYTIPQPKHLVPYAPPVQKAKPTPKKVSNTPTTTKPQTKFTKKVKNISLEELIQWALEIGIPQDKIDTHTHKTLGLAKMNIGNLIRGQLHRTNQLEPWLIIEEPHQE